MALLVLGVLAVSFSSIFIRLADAPALSVAFYRNTFAAAILVPIALRLHGNELRALSGRQLATAALAGALLALHFSLWIPSLSYISVGASTVLVTTQPVWVAGFARVRGERVSRRALAGIALSLAGALVIFGRDLGSADFRGDALAIGGAVAAAAYFVTGRSLRQRVSLLTYVAVAYTVCAAILGVVVALAGQPFFGFEPNVWWLFLLMALGPQILGHTVFNYLLGHVEPGVIAIAVTGEPVGATLLALAFFGEVPHWTAFVGGGLILAGIWVTIVAQARRAVPEAVVE